MDACSLTALRRVMMSPDDNDGVYEYTLHGCNPIQCTQPASTTGYTISSEGNLDLSQGAFDVSVSCATNYESTGSGPAATCQSDSSAHPGEECWSQFGCDDNGGTACSGCGSDGNWYCCMASGSYHEKIRAESGF